MVGLVIDFLTESDRIWQNLISLRLQRKIKVMHRRIDVPGPTYLDSGDHLLSTVFVIRRRQLRAVTESADQLLERLAYGFVWPAL
jgi:hypothetical protein